MILLFLFVIFFAQAAESTDHTALTAAIEVHCPKPAPTQYVGAEINPNEVRGRKALKALSDYDTARLAAVSRAHEECVAGLANGMAQLGLSTATAEQIRKGGDTTATVRKGRTEVASGEGVYANQPYGYGYGPGYGGVRYAATLGVPSQAQDMRNDQALANQRMAPMPTSAPAPVARTQAPAASAPVPTAEELERDRKLERLRAANEAVARQQ